MVSSVFPRPSRKDTPRDETHFICQNAVQAELMLVQEPVQRSQLVVAHRALNAGGLGLEVDHVHLRLLAQRQFVLHAVVHAHTASRVKAEVKQHFPCDLTEGVFFWLESMNWEKTVPCWERKRSIARRLAAVVISTSEGGSYE